MEIQPKVSVIIPVYNVELYLEQCLDSVVNQTLKEIQIICVNDGSTDGSFSILKRYAEKDHRIQVISQENQGLSQARNSGLSHVRGEYVYFIDSDDWLELDALERLADIADQKQLDVLYFAGVQESETQEDMGYFKRVESLGKEVFTGLELFQLQMETDTYFQNVWCQFYRSHFLKEHHNRFIPAIIFEDIRFSFDAIVSAKRVYSISHIFYHYRIRDNSIMTGVISKAHIESMITIWMESLLLIKRRNFNNEIILLCRRYLKKIREGINTNIHLKYGQIPWSLQHELDHLERIYFGEEPVFSNNQLSSLVEQRNLYQQLCFMGAGEECHKNMLFFKKNNLALPLAICDNNKEKQGTLIESVPVISFEEACLTYSDLFICITSLRFYETLKKQVVDRLGEGRIISFE